MIEVNHNSQSKMWRDKKQILYIFLSLLKYSKTWSLAGSSKNVRPHFLLLKKSQLNKHPVWENLLELLNNNWKLVTLQVGGLIVVALGIWTIVDKSFANHLLGTNLYAGAAYILLATGILVTFISCLGCMGSVKEVRCMLVIVS